MGRRRFIAVHDCGRVLTNVAVVLAEGGESISCVTNSAAWGRSPLPRRCGARWERSPAGKRKKMQAARARTRGLTCSAGGGSVGRAVLRLP